MEGVQAKTKGGKTNGKKYKGNELDGCYIVTESFNSDKIISLVFVTFFDPKND